MRRLCIMLVVAIEYATAAIATASQIAFDSAGDSAYNAAVVPGGSYSGLNGGYGWGSWSEGGDGNPFQLFMGSSSDNDTADLTGSGDINSPRSPLGRAWGLHADFHGDHLTTAIRLLSGPLLPGQTFMMDFDNYVPQRSAGDEVGVHLSGFALDAGRFSYTDYVIAPDDGTAFTDTGIPITDQGIHLELTVLDDSTARFSLASMAPSGREASFVLPFLGLNDVTIGNITSVSGEKDVYFNNMVITPEPAAALPCLISLASQALCRRRRRSKWSNVCRRSEGGADVPIC